MFVRNNPSPQKRDCQIFDGCILILILILVFSIFPKVSVKNVSGSMPVPPLVYVLENNDPDFRNPPFEDRLTIINPADHSKIREVARFGIDTYIGPPRLLAAADSGHTCLIVDQLLGQLIKYDFTRNEASTIVSLRINSIYVSENGDTYILTDTAILGRTIVKMDENGNIVKEVSYGGFNIVVDDAHDSIWIVGANITRLNRNLDKRFSMDPIAWAALSVDFTSDGSIWVCEGKHPEISGSKDRLLKITINGDIVKVIDLDTRPSHVSVDRNDDSFWLTTSRGLYKYDKDGNLLKQVETQPRWTVKVNQSDSSVWVAGFGDVKHYTKDGVLVAAVSGFSSSQAYIDFITVRDTVAPTTTVNTGSPKYAVDTFLFVSDATVFTFSAADDTSGVRETKYRIDSGTWNTYTAEFSLSYLSEGSHTIGYFSIDNAGNEESEKTLGVFLDKTPPIISVASPTGSLTQYFGATTVTFTVTVTDADSGVKEVKLTVDGVSQGAMDKTGDSYTKTLSLAEGSHSWSVEASDNVNNTATQKYTLSLQVMPIWIYAAIGVIIVVAVIVVLIFRRKPSAQQTFPPPPPPPR